jgi:hypothetical protein
MAVVGGRMNHTGIVRHRLLSMYTQAQSWNNIHPDTFPQENGNKTDVRWAALQDQNGMGLLIISRQPLEINAHHYLDEDIDERVRHTIDVPFQDLVEVCIDLHQMGVGGDNSWGNPVHDEYKLLAKEYSYGFIIRPVCGEGLEFLIQESLK